MYGVTLGDSLTFMTPRGNSCLGSGGLVVVELIDRATLRFLIGLVLV